MPHPLFAYGTLQPGGRYWPRVAHLIERTEPAQTAGYTLYHLINEGYPCVTIGDASLDGTLLWIREGAELEALTICDEIEGFFDADPSSLYMRQTCRTAASHGAASVTAWIYVFGPAHHHRLPSHAALVDDTSWVRWCSNNRQHTR